MHNVEITWYGSRARNTLHSKCNVRHGGVFLVSVRPLGGSQPKRT